MSSYHSGVYSGKDGLPASIGRLMCARMYACVGWGGGGVHGNFVHVFNSSMKCTHLGSISERALYNPTVIIIIIIIIIIIYY